jgi:hypothetical protein
VDLDGAIIDIKLLRGIHDSVDEIALQHIRNMPKSVRAGSRYGKKV